MHSLKRLCQRKWFHSMRELKTQTIKRVFYILILVYILTVGYPTVISYADKNENEHEHRFKIELIKKADKDNEGLRKYTCEICDFEYIEVIEPTGHMWGEWIIDIEPTYTAAGHMYRICSKYSHLQHYEEKEIPPLKKESSVKGQREDIDTVINNSKQLINNLKSGRRDEIINEVQDITETVGKISQEQEIQSKKPTREEDYRYKSLLGGPINIIDYISIGSILFLIPFYTIIILPLLRMLIWIKRKKEENKEE